MSKQTLATKYRPKTFDDVVEQTPIKMTLQEQLKTDTIKNCYLFTGGAGTGKTTDARIFANEINKGIGSPIEMDAASNNSVEDVRKIIEDAKYKSMTGEYKVYIIDECFPANTLVSTENGDKPISEIKIGDRVQSMTGINNVVNVYKNNVPTNRLCCVTINNHKIITTQDHLFFTQEGWIEARKLKKGDIVYDNKNLQKLWTDFYKKERQNSVLLSSMLSGVQESSLHTKDEENTMCNLWKNYNSTELLQTEDLFSTMQTSTYFKVKYNYYEYRIWNDAEETIFRKNEEGQPFKEYKQYREDEKNKGIERNATSMERTTRWKWKIYYSTNDLISSIRRWMGTRICNSNTLQTVRTPVSYLLQSRPRFTDNEISNRGRWERASIEKCTIKRFEENSMFEQFRVESVEIYKRGHNDELFQDSFTSSELHTNYVTMYDLEVENEHCYFVNNILVHNCHSLSNQAWQSLLKLIEEPPAKTVIVFCTTDPQKIPNTILSRVQRYDFRKISFNGIINRLKYIIEQENKENANIIPTEEGLEYIAKLADGGMRDAITTLDKCISYNSNLTLENVITALGGVNYDIMFNLVDSTYDYDSKNVITIIEDIYNSGANIKQFIKDFSDFVLDLCKYGLINSFDYIRIPTLYSNKLSAYTGEHYGFFNQLLGEMIKLSNLIKWESSPKSTIESTFILLCQKG